ADQIEKGHTKLERGGQCGRSRGRERGKPHPGVESKASVAPGAVQVDPEGREDEQETGPATWRTFRSERGRYREEFPVERHGALRDSTPAEMVQNTRSRGAAH